MKRTKKQSNQLVSEVINFANHITPDKKALSNWTKRTAKKFNISELGATDLLLTAYKVRVSKTKKRRKK